MSDLDKTWNTAVSELNDMLAANSDFCDAILAHGNAPNIDYNFHIDEDIKRRFSSSNLRDEFNKAVIADGSGDDDSYESDIDINHFIETREKAINELQQSIDAILEPGAVRGFGDIVKDGPNNREEETLLNSAKIFLTPSEFEEAVNKNSSPGDILTKIDQSAAMLVTKRILEEARKELMQEQEKDLEKPIVIEDSKGYYGVTDEVEKAARESLIIEDAKEVSPPPPTPENPEHEAKEGPDMDFFNNMRKK